MPQAVIQVIDQVIVDADDHTVGLTLGDVHVEEIADIYAVKISYYLLLANYIPGTGARGLCAADQQDHRDE